MTPRNFINAQLGTKRLWKFEEQTHWERARWMACVIINPHLKRSIEPQKITTFPWEKERKKKNIKSDLEKLKQMSEYDDRVQDLLKKKKK